MPISQPNALLAGQIAQAITMLQGLNAAIAQITATGGKITKLSADMTDAQGNPAGQLIFAQPLSAADTATMLAAFQAFANAQIAVLGAELAAVPTA